MSFVSLCRMSTLAVAVLWLVAAVPARAGLEDGQAFFDLGRWDKAMAELRPLAEAGDVTAQFLVAQMLDEGGHGIVEDRAAALLWYHRAAARDHVSAQYALFLHYSVTPGPANQRQEKAMAWARRIAEAGPGLQGHDRLQAAVVADSLGTYHARGLMVPADPVVAYRWYAVAERLGWADAGRARQGLAGTMTDEQRAAAEAAAGQWWAAHAP
ncbi:MAG: tetratricopeptide repeat protein [Alphaproteobacteria bacterium]